MNLAIVHFHLNRGGVTQVILNHLRALGSQAASGCVVVVYGGRRQNWPEHMQDELATQGIELTLLAVPSLEYEYERRDSQQLADDIQRALGDAGFAPQKTVLHVHNHALGKNVSTPGAIQLLAERGFGVLLQIHDFAEDFRPTNYVYLRTAIGPDSLAEELYPQRPGVHYAVLNGRDREILNRAGFASERLHDLPNPVFAPSSLPEKSLAREKLQRLFDVRPDQRLLLYPVRGIRRKNTGEMLLWSLLAPPDTVVGMTLPPLNPVETPRYDAWKTLAAELNLPVRFELGADGGLSFGENLAAADAILTTSVVEGFGMVYLESWLFGRPLVGRNLPEITGDFVERGLDFGSLYTRLQVPVDWVGETEFAQMVSTAYDAARAEYSISAETEERDRAAEDQVRQQLIVDGCVDFGQLNAALQESVIRRVAGDDGSRDTLRQLNPLTEQPLLDLQALDPVVASNGEIVTREYSLSGTGKRLTSLYRQVLDDRGTGELASSLQTASAETTSSQQAAALRGERILEAFLDITRFHPLCVEP